MLSIDRETEVAATRAASAAGVAPEVVRWLPEQRVLVTRFMPGRPIDAEELREPATLATVAGALRRIHDGPPLATAFPTFTLVREYADTARARGGERARRGPRASRWSSRTASRRCSAIARATSSCPATTTC